MQDPNAVLPVRFDVHRVNEKPDAFVAFGILPSDKVVVSHEGADDFQSDHHMAVTNGLQSEDAFKARGYLTTIKGTDGEYHPVAVVYGSVGDPEFYSGGAADRIDAFNANFDKILKATGYQVPDETYVSLTGGFDGIRLSDWAQNPRLYQEAWHGSPYNFERFSAGWARVKGRRRMDGACTSPMKSQSPSTTIRS